MTDSARQGAAVDEVPGLDPWSHLDLLAPFEAKLQPSRARPGIVARPALVERLAATVGVVLVTAPAGYGKTTLLSQYAASEPRLAWLSLASDDNDLTALAAYLVRALDAVDPLQPEELASILTPGADGPTVLLPRLGRILAGRRAPFTLVLDDVHLLTERHCRRAVEVLVSHLPAGATLVLSGRTDPQLQRARLRTQLTVLEIGPDDLALNANDGVELLRRAGLELDGDSAARLVEQAEGWPAGVYIAGLAASDDAHNLVDEYFYEQVISGLDEATVDFLLRVSVLDHLDGIVCDELLERSDSAPTLARLAESHLFVVPLTAPPDAYRLHHLFSEALRRELRRRDPAGERELHARASLIHEARGEPGEAIHHAVQAGQTERAATLTWAYAQTMLGMGRGATVTRWMQWFSDGDFEAEPTLCLSMAWCCVTANEQAPIDVWLDLARQHPPETPVGGTGILGSALDALDAVACEQGVEAMVGAATRSLAVDGGPSPQSGVARYLAGAGLALLGAPDRAQELLEEVVQTGALTPAPASLALTQLALLALDRDDWREATRLAEHARALNQRFRLGERPFQAAVPAVCGLVAAHNGDIATARQEIGHARRLITHAVRFSTWQPIQNLLLLARAELFLHDPHAARLLWREAGARLEPFPHAGRLPEQLATLGEQITAEGARSDGLGAPLTTAELRVLCYLPTHLSYQGIAEDLFVSRNTIKSQAIAIYRKLQVTSRQAAVARARDLGLLDDTAAPSP